MSAVTWCSSWSISTNVNVHVQLLNESVATLSSLPLHLTRPEGDASVPCQLSLLWAQQPLRCTQLQLEVQCSARHVEVYAEGTRHNLLGEMEKGEVYLGTFRGTKKSSEPQLFAMSPSFMSNKDCDVLKSLQTLRIKFVSLMGDKSVLNLQEFRCIFNPMEPVDTSTAGLTGKIAGLDLKGVSGGALDMQMLLKGFQQTMEREMETKITRVMDAKISALVQRLALSEQALLHLHKKMDTKDAHVQGSLDEMKQKFWQLEDQLSQFSVAKEVEREKKDDPDYARTIAAKRRIVSDQGVPPSHGKQATIALGVRELQILVKRLE
ncbi:unnamed protein product [Peronospora farinosa]|uniref:Uncharacterized protein n=1 Tax=Peronospora farinosa TaxID=134698 RepID=A0AAV0UAB7_9STRA|nr:unnamed protein product [Peronospora farinosa]CAI5732400.1 unnamed protein product [Peronospora farinosa]